MVEFKEIAFAVNHALLKYNQFSPTEIYERIDWLERAIAFLLSGLMAKREIIANKEEEDVEEDLKTLDVAINDLKNILAKLRRIMTERRLHELLAKTHLSGWRNPTAVTELFQVIEDVNALRNQVVKIMIDTGFEKFAPLIVGGEIEENENGKKKPKTWKNYKQT